MSSLAMDHPITDPNVTAAFDAFPKAERDRLHELRALILTTAGETDGVGTIQETLKWGQPSYLTPETKSGTTIRLGAGRPDHISIYTHCQTTVISDFELMHPTVFDIEGNRAVHLPLQNEIPTEAITRLIRAALTYHQNK